MTCPQADAIGAYVLEALDTDEHLKLERHIRTCTSCQKAVQQFAHLPAVLHSLTLEDVMALPFDDGPDHDSSGDGCPMVPRYRRLTSRRALLAAAAAVVLVVTGGLIDRQISNAPVSTRSDVTWSATDGVNGIDAQVQLSSRSWGTDIQIGLDDLKPGLRCMLVVHTRSGQSETTGWWMTTAVRDADIPASSSFALSDIARVDVVTADNAVLASLTQSTR